MKVTLTQEDADRLGVEREAEYRSVMKGERYVDAIGKMRTSAAGFSAPWIVVTPRARSFVDQLNESGWDPGVRHATLKVSTDGVAYVVREGRCVATLTQKCPIRPAAAFRVWVRPDGTFGEVDPCTSN